MTKAEAQLKASSFLKTFVEQADLARMIFNDLTNKDLTLPLQTRADIVEAVLPIVENALKETVDVLDFDARSEIQKRTAQEQRVAAIVEQFGLDDKMDNHDINLSELTDALFGAEK